MANSIDSKLAVDIAIQTANAVAANRISGFNTGVYDFSDEANPIRRGMPVNAQISLVTSSGAVAVNPTSFEGLNTTVAAKTVKVDLLSAQFGAEWSSAASVEQMVKDAMNRLCDKMVATRDALFTVSNFGALNTFDIAGATTGDAKDELFQAIWALQTKGSSKYLIAGSALYAKGMPTNMQSFDPLNGGRIRGFDGYFEDGLLADVDPDGDTATLGKGDLKGVVTDGNGVALVSRVPQWTQRVSGLLESSNITLDNIGMTVQLNFWGSTVGRIDYGSLDVVFGAGVYDTTATKLIGQIA